MTLFLVKLKYHLFQRDVVDYDQAVALCTASINGSLTVTSYSDLLAGESTDNVIEQCAFDVDVSFIQISYYVQTNVPKPI